jgi:hypothetical protein
MTVNGNCVFSNEVTKSIASAFQILRERCRKLIYYALNLPPPPFFPLFFVHGLEKLIACH